MLLILRLHSGHDLYLQGVQEGIILISRLYSGHDLYFQGVQEGIILISRLYSGQLVMIFIFKPSRRA